MFYKIVFYRKNIFDELERVKTERAEFTSYGAARVWAQNQLYKMAGAVAVNVFMDI